MNIPDAALILGATMRATRLVVADAVPGRWLIKEPIDRAMERYEAAHPNGPEPWWWRYRSGLDCMWCAGLWIAGGVLASYHLTRGTRLESAWRFGATALTLNLIAATVGGQLDIYDDPEDEPHPQVEGEGDE